MPLWIQNLAVFLLVLACIAVIARQAFASLAGRKSRLGQCCNKGCSTTPQSQPPTNRIVFMPADMLRRRK